MLSEIVTIAPQLILNALFILPFKSSGKSDSLDHWQEERTDKRVGKEVKKRLALPPILDPATPITDFDPHLPLASSLS